MPWAQVDSEVAVLQRALVEAKGDRDKVRAELAEVRQAVDADPSETIADAMRSWVDETCARADKHIDMARAANASADAAYAENHALRALLSDVVRHMMMTTAMPCDDAAVAKALVAAVARGMVLVGRINVVLKPTTTERPGVYGGDE